jgi:hypothetical protein
MSNNEIRMTNECPNDDNDLPRGLPFSLKDRPEPRTTFGVNFLKRTLSIVMHGGVRLCRPLNPPERPVNKL